MRLRRREAEAATGAAKGRAAEGRAAKGADGQGRPRGGLPRGGLPRGGLPPTPCWDGQGAGCQGRGRPRTAKALDSQGPRTAKAPDGQGTGRPRPRMSKVPDVQGPGSGRPRSRTSKAGAGNVDKHYKYNGFQQNIEITKPGFARTSKDLARTSKGSDVQGLGRPRARTSKGSPLTRTSKGTYVQGFGRPRASHSDTGAR